jgi:hypothetical protein
MERGDVDDEDEAVSPTDTNAHRMLLLCLVLLPDPIRLPMLLVAIHIIEQSDQMKLQMNRLLAPHSTQFKRMQQKQIEGASSR